MTLMDTADGMFMTVAYDWAFAHPVRKVSYNVTITGLSAAVALLIGTIGLVGVLHERLGLTDPVTGAIGAVDLGNVGFVIVGLFVLTWAAAIGYWRISGAEERWAVTFGPSGTDRDVTVLREVVAREQMPP